MDDYVQIMVESLRRKSDLLERIIGKNVEQNKCISGKEYEDIDWDAFNLLVTEKEILIERINTMDEGFQSLYDRVKAQLNESKDKYSDSIKEMQFLIGKVTDQGVEIQAGEERNKQIIDSLMFSRKKTIRQTRNSLKVADSYNQSMHMSYGSDNFMLNRKK